jgi:hypothetical protein
MPTQGQRSFVRKLGDDPDWRAAAFLLERGYRERWGRAEPPQNSPTITLTDKQLTALLEALRYVEARHVTPPIEAEATRGCPATTSRDALHVKGLSLQATNGT